MTAVPLTLLLVAILAILVAVTPGAFSFDRWPDAPQSALSERDVVVDVPVSVKDGARADARRAPAIEREGATLAVKHQPEPTERREAPVAAPDAPQIVAQTDPIQVEDPVSGGEGATSRPVRDQPAAEEAEPVQDFAPDLPTLPGIPAKDLPADPDPVLPQWDDDHAARPRGLRDDQE